MGIMVWTKCPDLCYRIAGGRIATPQNRSMPRCFGDGFGASGLSLVGGAECGPGLGAPAMRALGLAARDSLDLEHT